LAEFLCIRSPEALVHSAPTHLCRFLVRFSTHDSFRDEVDSSSFHREDFSPHSRILSILSVLHRNHLISHLVSPFSFPLGTVLTQLEILFMLEPLGFRPNGFSPSFSLLMSTFSLLIALAFASKSYRLPFSRYTERSTTSSQKASFSK